MCRYTRGKIISKGKDIDKYEKEIEKAKETIEKFSNLPEMEDHYEKYLYKQKYFIEPVLEATSKKNYTKWVYDDPLVLYTFACEIEGKNEGWKTIILIMSYF